MPAVQLTYTDGPGPRFPGQIDNAADYMFNSELRSYVLQTLVAAGRWVVRGTPVIGTADPVQTPFPVKAVLAGSVLADLVGVVIRTANMSGDANGLAVQTRVPTMQAVADLSSEAIIGAQVPAGITIVHGDPVYVSVSHATIPVGEMSNAAATGLIGPVVGATWYGAAAAGTVGRVRLGA